MIDLNNITHITLLIAILLFPLLTYFIVLPLINKIKKETDIYKLEDNYSKLIQNRDSLIVL